MTTIARIPSHTVANSGSRFVEFLFPAILGVGASLAALQSTSWVRMWTVAGTLFVAFKWLTWRSRMPRAMAASHWKTLGYFAAWPGLEAGEFFRPCKPRAQPTPTEWIEAIAKTSFGAMLLWGLVRLAPADHPRLIGALGMMGIIVFLHFGLFHIFALTWQHWGTDVRPIMNSPARAISVADFWGNRWNRAYRRVSFDYFFRPCATHFGSIAGTLMAFLISGLIHELVVSFPAGAGYGYPTAYFVLQGLALIAERSPFGRRLLEPNQNHGRFWTALVTLAPVGLLFHAPFLTRVIVPFLQAIGAC